MFQDNLKALRKKKGITQEELAARLNVVDVYKRQASTMS